jgi:hypothetical protein
MKLSTFRKKTLNETERIHGEFTVVGSSNTQENAQNEIKSLRRKRRIT